MPMPIQRRFASVFLSLAVAAAASGAALAQKKYDTGASDTEIKIGNIVPYSGPASAYGVVGKAMGAVFKKVNDEGGINGRKINFISYDDAYARRRRSSRRASWSRATRCCCCSARWAPPPTPRSRNTSTARRCRNCSSPPAPPNGTTRRTFPGPWAGCPATRASPHLRKVSSTKEKPAAKIAVLYQNDDMGKDYLKGLKDGLANEASRIVAEESYEVAEPTIDSHVVRLKSSNPDIIIFFTTPKFGAQAIKKIGEMNWKPRHDRIQCLSLDRDRDAARRPRQFARGDLGGLRQGRQRSPVEQRSRHQGLDELLAKYLPETNRVDASAMTGYNMATTMVEVLRQCGDNLTRENVMKQAASLSSSRRAVCFPASHSPPAPMISSRSSKCR